MRRVATPSAILVLLALVSGVLGVLPAEAHGTRRPDATARYTTGGPYGGRISSLAIDPQARVFYAGVWTPTSGVYRSSDLAGHWTAVNSGLTAVQDAFGGVTAVAADPVHSGTVYAGYDNLEGVFKTTDGGAHWDSVGREFSDNILALAIDPSHPAIVYAGTEEGLDKSTDAGEHWSHVGLPGAGSIGVTALAIDPTHPETVYAGGGGLWRSTDAGASWESLPTPFGAVVSSIGIDSAHSSNVYVSINRFIRARSRVIKTSDGGDTWAVLHVAISGSVRLGPIAVDPTRPHTIYVGTTADGAGIEKSADGGATWGPANAGLSSRAVFALAATPSGHGTLLVAGTGQGVFVSTDRARRWVSANRGLAASSVTSLSVDPSAPGVVYAGPEGSGLLKSTDDGRHWAPADKGLPRGTTAKAVAVAPSDSRIVYVVAGDLLYASEDAGRTWTRRSGPLRLTSVRTLLVTPKHPSVLYIASENTGRQILKSADGGRHWAAETTGLPWSVTGLVIDPTMPWILHAGTTHGLFTTRSAGGSWSKARGADAPVYIRGLATDPTQPGTIYAGDSSAVYVSADRGKTWARHSFSSSGDVVMTAMAADTVHPGVLFFGTSEYFGEGGLERSTDGGLTWAKVPSVPAPITQLAIGADSVVQVGTSGHSVWSGPAA